MEICGVVPKNSDGQPILDLIFLGMGEDGHVASLFPNANRRDISESDFLPDKKFAQAAAQSHVSLSYAAIAAAREVWVLASGAGKKTALRESVSENGRTPLARVIQSRPRTRIFSDIRLGFVTVWLIADIL